MSHMQRYPFLAQYNETSQYEDVVIFMTDAHSGLVLYIPPDLTPGDPRAELNIFGTLAPAKAEIDDYEGSVIIRTTADPILGD